jgi:hypothetical protein
MNAIDIIGKDVINRLRENGFVVIHQQPTVSILKAMSSSCGGYHDCNLRNAYHRAIGESIRLQNIKGSENETNTY